MSIDGPSHRSVSGRAACPTAALRQPDAPGVTVTCRVPMSTSGYRAAVALLEATLSTSLVCGDPDARCANALVAALRDATVRP